MHDQNIAWVFDDPERFVTMAACKDTIYAPDLNNNNGRWNVSNIHWYWRNASWWYDKHHINWSAHSIEQRPSRYLYPIGAFSSPDWWAGAEGNSHGFVNMFNIIPQAVIADVQQGRALLVIDNLNEGFHLPWLWKFFHESCAAAQISAGSVLWLNGNAREAQAYSRWALENAITSPLKVISFCHLMYQQRIAFNTQSSPSWEDHLQHKQQKNIRLYNCLNRIQRYHREYFILRLIQENLWQHGLVSHDRLAFEWYDRDITPITINKATRMLPAVIDDADFANNKAMTINTQIYLDSWISVITETHANDDPNQLFVSEKVWKPIYCRHPFLLLGNRWTCTELQDQGYRCDWLGQMTWDSKPLDYRIDGILAALRLLLQQGNILAWYDSLQDDCEHNHALFMRQDFFNSPACDDIVRAYRSLK